MSMLRDNRDPSLVLRCSSRILSDHTSPTNSITGGGSGIGFAFAKACHLKGARVLIGDLKLTSDAEEYISKSSNSEVRFQKCDVSSWDDLHDLISASVEKFGQVTSPIEKARWHRQADHCLEVPDVYSPVGTY